MSLNKNWWKYVLGLWMAVVIVAAFLYAPRAKDLGESTRILFFHVPCAWIATHSTASSISARKIYGMIYTPILPPISG